MNRSLDIILCTDYAKDTVDLDLIFSNKKVSNYSDFLKSNFLRFCTHTRVALTSMVKHTDINTQGKIVKATR